MSAPARSMEHVPSQDRTQSSKMSPASSYFSLGHTAVDAALSWCARNASRLRRLRVRQQRETAIRGPPMNWGAPACLPDPMPFSLPRARRLSSPLSLSLARAVSSRIRPARPEVSAPAPARQKPGGAAAGHVYPGQGGCSDASRRGRHAGEGQRQGPGGDSRCLIVKQRTGGAASCCQWRDGYRAIARLRAWIHDCNRGAAELVRC